MYYSTVYVVLVYIEQRQKIDIVSNEKLGTHHSAVSRQVVTWHLVRFDARIRLR
jgi:hypothetical protein